MAEGRFSGDRAKLKGAFSQTVGAYTFALVSRRVGDDGGHTIHVMGPVKGEEEEVLRFDCFEQQPHYHLGFSHTNGPIVPIDEADPFDWSVGKIRSSFKELLEAAGADGEYQEEWASDLDAVLDRIVDRASELANP
jgi:hypothetical protein